jgi:hypothetical protein
MNIIAKGVKVTGPVNIKFHPELIDRIQFKSLFDDAFEKCEFWGTHEPDEEPKDEYYEFGTLGRCLDVKVYKDKTVFFSGEGITIYYHRKFPSEFLLLKPDCRIDHDISEIITTNFNPEYIINKRPISVYDFTMMLNSFLIHIEAAAYDYFLNFYFTQKEHEYKAFLDRKAKRDAGIDEDDLPF